MKWVFLAFRSNVLDQKRLYLTITTPLKEHMKTSMLIQALDSAVKKKFLEKTNQLIFHYASNTFRKYLKDIRAVSP